jgi:hypothetical protein
MGFVAFAAVLGVNSAAGFVPPILGFIPIY